MSLGTMASGREAVHSQRILEWTIYTRLYDCIRGILEIEHVEEGIIQKVPATSMEELRGMSFLEISAPKNKFPASISKADLDLSASSSCRLSGKNYTTGLIPGHMILRF